MSVWCSGVAFGHRRTVLGSAGRGSRPTPQGGWLVPDEPVYPACVYIRMVPDGLESTYLSCLVSPLPWRDAGDILIRQVPSFYTCIVSSVVQADTRAPSALLWPKLEWVASAKTCLTRDLHLSTPRTRKTLRVLTAARDDESGCGLGGTGAQIDFL